MFRHLSFKLTLDHDSWNRNLGSLWFLNVLRIIFHLFGWSANICIPNSKIDESCSLQTRFNGFRVKSKSRLLVVWFRDGVTGDVNWGWANVLALVWTLGRWMLCGGCILGFVPMYGKFAVRKKVIIIFSYPGITHNKYTWCWTELGLTVSRCETCIIRLRIGLFIMSLWSRLSTWNPVFNENRARNTFGIQYRL